MATATLQKHYARILRLWPRDVLRGVTFHDAFKRRLNSRLLEAGSVAGSEMQAPSVAKAEAQNDEAQLNALYSLLDNRYSRQYPVSDKLLHPNFKPSYYEDLAREMEEAPRRSWWDQKLLRWSKIVRIN